MQTRKHADDTLVLEKQITKQMAEMLDKYQHIELKNCDEIHHEILQIKRALKELKYENSKSP